MFLLHFLDLTEYMSHFIVAYGIGLPSQLH